MTAKSKTSGQQALTLQRRAAVGRRPVKHLRGQGLVPGVIYGKGVEPLPVAVNQRELAKLLHVKGGEHSLVTLRIEDGASWEKPALIQGVQHDPVDGRILHVDFHTIVLTERLKVKVPLVLTGEPVGVKQEGGILEQFLRDIEVECLPANIPAQVAFDISQLKIGATVHVKDLVPPAEAKITSDGEGVVASVQAPKEEKLEEAAAAPAEPEVLREKKAEEEASAEGKAEAPAKPEKGEKKEAKG